MHFKMLSTKSRPFCLILSVLEKHQYISTFSKGVWNYNISDSNDFSLNFLKCQPKSLWIIVDPSNYVTSVLIES